MRRLTHGSTPSSGPGPPALFSLILRRAPRPTLFPYTTLFRSYHEPQRSDQPAQVPVRLRAVRPRGDVVRSEEHTSELQSRVDIVCRLLLEKKNSLPQVERDLTGETVGEPDQDVPMLLKRVPLD